MDSPRDDERRPGRGGVNVEQNSSNTKDCTARTDNMLVSCRENSCVGRHRRGYACPLCGTDETPDAETNQRHAQPALPRPGRS